MSALEFPFKIPGYGYIQDQKAFELFCLDYQGVIRRNRILNGDNERMYDREPIDVVIFQNEGCVVEHAVTLYPAQVRLTLVDLSELEAQAKDHQGPEDFVPAIVMGNLHTIQETISIERTIIEYINDTFDHYLIIDDGKLTDGSVE